MNKIEVESSRRRLPDQIEDLGFDRRVEAGRRLVENQQLGIDRQRDRERNALLHAAG